MKGNCPECETKDVNLVPMGLFGQRFNVCQKCKDKIRKQAKIDEMSYGMRVYFETGVDSIPESNDDYW